MQFLSPGEIKPEGHTAPNYVVEKSVKSRDHQFTVGDRHTLLVDLPVANQTPSVSDCGSARRVRGATPSFEP